MAKVTDTRKFDGSCGEKKFSFTFSHPIEDRCANEKRQIAALTNWLDTGGQLPLELNFLDTTNVTMNSVTLQMDKPRKGSTKCSVGLSAAGMREEDVQALFNATLTRLN